MHINKKYFIFFSLAFLLAISLVSAIGFPKTEIHFTNQDLKYASEGIKSGVIEPESFLYFIDNINDDGNLKESCTPLRYNYDTEEYTLHCLEIPLYKDAGDIIHSYLASQYFSRIVFSKDSQYSSVDISSSLTGFQILENPNPLSTIPVNNTPDQLGVAPRNNYGIQPPPAPEEPPVPPGNCNNAQTGYSPCPNMSQDPWNEANPDWDLTDPTDPRNAEEFERAKEKELERINELKQELAERKAARDAENTPEKINERLAERDKMLAEMKKEAEDYRKEKAKELAELDPDKEARDAESEQKKADVLARDEQRKKEMEDYNSPENIKKRLDERAQRYNVAKAAEDYRNEQRAAELAQTESETQNEINGGSPPIQTTDTTPPKSEERPYLELDGKKYYTEVKKGFFGDKVVWKDPDTGKELSKREQNKASFVDSVSTASTTSSMTTVL